MPQVYCGEGESIDNAVKRSSHYSFLGRRYGITGVRLIPRTQITRYTSLRDAQGLTSQTFGRSSPSTTQPIPLITTSQPTIIDWDNTELAINIPSLGLNIIWLLVILLELDTPDPPHWKGFQLTTLLTNFEIGIGNKPNTTRHEIIYDNFTFSGQGGYSIALKRFVALEEGRGETFRLRSGVEGEKTEMPLAAEVDGRQVL